MDPNANLYASEAFHGSIQTIDDALLLIEAANIKRWTDGRYWSNSRMKGRFFLYKELPSSKKLVYAARQRTRAAPAAAAAAPASTSDESAPDGPAPADSDAASSTAAAPAAAAPEDSLAALTTGDPTDREYFRKKTISVRTRRGEKFHLVAYYLERDVKDGLLQRPSMLPQFASLHVEPGFYLTGLDSTPLMITNSREAVRDHAIAAAPAAGAPVPALPTGPAYAPDPHVAMYDAGHAYYGHQPPPAHPAAVAGHLNQVSPDASLASSSAYSGTTRISSDSAIDLSATAAGVAYHHPQHSHHPHHGYRVPSIRGTTPLSSNASVGGPVAADRRPVTGPHGPYMRPPTHAYPSSHYRPSPGSIRSNSPPAPYPPGVAHDPYRPYPRRADAHAPVSDPRWPAAGSSAAASEVASIDDLASTASLGPPQVPMSLRMRHHRVSSGTGPAGPGTEYHQYPEQPLHQQAVYPPHHHPAAMPYPPAPPASRPAKRPRPRDGDDARSEYSDRTAGSSHSAAAAAVAAKRARHGMEMLAHVATTVAAAEQQQQQDEIRRASESSSDAAAEAVNASGLSPPMQDTHLGPAAPADPAGRAPVYSAHGFYPDMPERAHAPAGQGFGSSEAGVHHRAHYDPLPPRMRHAHPDEYYHHQQQAHQVHARHLSVADGHGAAPYGGEHGQSALAARDHWDSSSSSVRAPPAPSAAYLQQWLRYPSGGPSNGPAAYGSLGLSRAPPALTPPGVGTLHHPADDVSPPVAPQYPVHAAATRARGHAGYAPNYARDTPDAYGGYPPSAVPLPPGHASVVGAADRDYPAVYPAPAQYQQQYSPHHHQLAHADALHQAQMQRQLAAASGAAYGHPPKHGINPAARFARRPVPPPPPMMMHHGAAAVQGVPPTAPHRR
ncbi:Global transcription regulator sge1 [Blastocladiella emersonii ATCC 22665]|nr:Global transcription regulator sge1 [Blastocladiella emersonii ATCC 22665]